MTAARESSEVWTQTLGIYVGKTCDFNGFRFRHDLFMNSIILHVFA